MTLQSAGSAELDGEIAALGPWFHNLHLPEGIQTAPDHPLGDFPAFKWEDVGAALPDDLTGCHALDIGCNAGYYSFELAQRGAHVLGIDHDEHYLTQARWARSRLGLDDRVDLRRLGVYDIDRLGRTFDLVLFMGVLYHLRHPLLALDVVAGALAPRGTLVLQTLTMPAEPEIDVPADLTLDERARLRQPGWPHMAFIEHAMAGDPTNWWVADPAAVEAMVRSTGLRVLSRPGPEMWLCERARENPHLEELRQARGR